MRTAYNEVGFVVEDGVLKAFNLGYDFCAEHEYGMPVIMDAMGVALPKYPFGVQDRVMTEVPERLIFKTYDWRPKDRRFKKTTPAAVLLLRSPTAWHDEPDESGAEIAKRFGASFRIDPQDKTLYKPERHNVTCSWAGRSGFCINVRGEENVALLKQLHEAILRKDIALGLGRMAGFARTSPALVIASTVSAEIHANVEEADRAHRVLYEALEATGIEKELQDAKIGYYALSPAWTGEEGSDLVCFINPMNQQQNSYGWFTLAELREWIQGKGPVVDSQEIRDSIKARRSDFEIDIIKMLKEKDMGLRLSPVYTYMDAERKVPGIRLLTAENTQAFLPSGLYPLSQIEAMVDAFKASQTAATA